MQYEVGLGATPPKGLVGTDMLKENGQEAADSTPSQASVSSGAFRITRVSVILQTAIPCRQLAALSKGAPLCLECDN